MYGYPKHISTKADVEYLMGYLGSGWATQENIARGLNFLRGLIEHSKSYVFDRVLAEGEAADGSEPDYLVLTQEGGARHQMVLADDPAARIHRMGLSVAEVESMIQMIEGGA